MHRLAATAVALLGLAVGLRAQADAQPLRVFIFAGQSNMVGADSKVRDIDRFPPYVGLGKPQQKVRFSYCIGRENKTRSDGWTQLQPIRGMVGPELSFAREVGRHIDAPIAIIKCAAGGTHLGGDWNPDQPSGFKLYPMTLKWIRAALADLKRQGLRYRIEGFMWHQGENDMFKPGYMEQYGANLKNFLASWRRDLGVPDLRFYIGELCTKTIWGMDLRSRMYAISRGQRAVTEADPHAFYIPTSHVGVEIGGGVGLHYHYGTLGQLQHGVNYARAYLTNIGKAPAQTRPLKKWPYAAGSKVQLFVLAGHRNMEGERAFVQELGGLAGGRRLRQDVPQIAYRYHSGAGFKVSPGWEPLGPAGSYDTFGPELSFAAALRAKLRGDIAIARFTDSGSQIIDWTPAGSMAKSRHVYPRFVDFVRQSRQQLIDKGHEVELVGIFYHLGENDMSWGPSRKRAIGRLLSLVKQSRVDLELPELPWFVSQQPPTDDARVNGIEVTGVLAKAAAVDPVLHHVRAFDLPPQPEKLVLNSAGVVALGELLAAAYLRQR